MKWKQYLAVMTAAAMVISECGSTDESGIRSRCSGSRSTGK